MNECPADIIDAHCQHVNTELWEICVFFEGDGLMIGS